MKFFQKNKIHILFAIIFISIFSFSITKAISLGGGNTVNPLPRSGTSTSLTPTQIGFGSASSTIVGSPDLTFDTSTNTFTVKSYGVTQLQTSNVSGIQQFGDVGNDWFKNILNINGPGRIITLEDSNNPYLSIDRSNNTYQLGDINNTNNGTVAKVYDNGAVFTVLGNEQTVNGLNLDFSGKYYTLGDGLSSTATYIQAHNSTGQSSIIMNGNLGNLGTQQNGLSLDFIGQIFSLGDTGDAINGTKLTVDNAQESVSANGLIYGNSATGLYANFLDKQYEIGDTNGIYNGTRVVVDDNNSTVKIVGNKAITGNVQPFGGTGLDDLLPSGWTGTYSASALTTIKVWIDHLNAQYLQYSSETGILSGTIHQGGVSGTLVTDNATNLVFVDNVTGGVFDTSSPVTDGTNSFTPTSATVIADTFAHTDTHFGIYSYATPINGVAQDAGFGILVKFDNLTGHDIGDDLTAYWSKDFSASVKGLAEFNGANHTVTLGDIDNIGNSTTLKVDDASSTISMSVEPTYPLTATGTLIGSSDSSPTSTEITLGSNLSITGNTLNAVGVPATLASGDLTAKTSSKNVVTATSSSATTTYDIGGYVNITTSIASVLNFKITFKDENNASQTILLIPQGATGAAAVNLITGGFYAISPITIRVYPSSTIKLDVVYTGGTSVYDAGGYIRQAY